MNRCKIESEAMARRLGERSLESLLTRRARERRIASLEAEAEAERRFAAGLERRKAERRAADSAAVSAWLARFDAIRLAIS